MAFHAQNATLISNIIKFTRNIDFLKETLCNFEPDQFLEKYTSLQRTRDESVAAIVRNLRWNENNKKGLKWNSSKSKPKNRDAIAKRYANTLLDCAIFLNKYKGREDFKKDLENHLKESGYKGLIQFFRENVPNGFSIALSCDFLKEFDRAFDLPKPDIHIKDVLCAYLSLEDGYYHTEKREYECIDQFIKIVKEINLNLESKITAYQLDRMIWLICSESFFLDSTGDSKERFISEIM